MTKLTRRKVVMGGVAASVSAPFTGMPTSLAHAATPQNHKVDITGFTFSPDTLDVRVGDTVTWINRDIAPHTATALDVTWDTATLERGQSGHVLIVEGMSPAYFCQHHPSMKGMLRIVSTP